MARIPQITPVHFGDLEYAVAIHGFDYGNMAIDTVDTILIEQEGGCHTDLRVVIHAQAVQGGAAPPVAVIAKIERRADAYLFAVLVCPIRVLTGSIGAAVITVRRTLATAATAATAGNYRSEGRRWCGSGNRGHRSRRHTVLVTGVRPIDGIPLFLLVLTTVRIDLESSQYGLGCLLGRLGTQTINHGGQFVTLCFAFLTQLIQSVMLAPRGFSGGLYGGGPLTGLGPEHSDLPFDGRQALATILRRAQ